MSILVNLHHLRQEYRSASLIESEVDKNPILQFSNWFQDAIKVQKEPNAMTLATANINGVPSQRTLLLKSFDERGFSFFTNYNSRKGQELAQNPFASMLFFWIELERQVNIEGRIHKLGQEESENYFHSRPRDSKIGAWVSMQDTEIPNREILSTDLQTLTQKFEGIDDIPMPNYWGGYILIPSKIEFWQGRPARLHDRLIYEIQEDKSWEIKRLAP